MGKHFGTSCKTISCHRDERKLFFLQGQQAETTCVPPPQFLAPSSKPSLAFTVALNIHSRPAPIPCCCKLYPSKISFQEWIRLGQFSSVGRWVLRNAISHTARIPLNCSERVEKTKGQKMVLGEKGATPYSDFLGLWCKC